MGPKLLNVNGRGRETTISAAIMIPAARTINEDTLTMFCININTLEPTKLNALTTLKLQCPCVGHNIIIRSFFPI